MRQLLILIGMIVMLAGNSTRNASAAEKLVAGYSSISPAEWTLVTAAKTNLFEKYGLDVSTVYLGGSTRIVASPASTGRSYALTDSSECCRPVLGHVFAGPGGRVGVSSTRFETGNGNVSYRWTVTIGPRETVALSSGVSSPSMPADSMCARISTSGRVSGGGTCSKR